MRRSGTTLFWIGFIITIGIVTAYIVTLVIDVTCFTSWITSLTLCGGVLVGSIMMLIGRAIERHYGDEI